MKKPLLSLPQPFAPLSALAIALIFALLLAPPAFSDYEQGVEAAQRGEYELALKEFKISAEQGLELAQYNLGILYFMGQGTKRDYKLALEWTTKAAEQGHTAAQFNLGTLYFNGNGTKKNHEEALKWYLIAAEANHVDAQLTVATMYRQGQGTEKNLVQAYTWASKAKDNENPDAQDLLKSLSGSMDESEIKSATSAFVQWQINR